VDWERLKQASIKKELPLHPYFTSQPTSLIEEYISFFTKEGDLVLDPYAGSGTTGVAATTLNRNAILVDLAPLATFICNATFSEVDLVDIHNCYEKLVTTLKDEINSLYQNGFKLPEKFYFPNGDLPPNADSKKVEDIFTRRNLYALSLLINKINKISNPKTKEFFMIVFSGMLHRASKTFFYDKAKWGGGNSSIFTKYRYWVPSKPDERNVWGLFEIRYKRTINKKIKLMQKSKGKIDVKNCSATSLDGVKDNSIDYIYTDPPYGANIAYLDLSMMWHSWLNLDTKFDRKLEAIEGGQLNKKQEDYLKILEESFKEMYRVLKPEMYLSLVFQHKNLDLWHKLVKICEATGFEYVNTLAYSSFYSTYHKNKNPLSVLSGQLIINFKKNLQKKFLYPRNKKEIEKIVERIVNELVEKNKATNENIINKVIPEILEEGVSTKQFNIINFLQDNYSFGNDKKWRPKYKNKILDRLKGKYECIIIDLEFPSEISKKEISTMVSEIIFKAKENLDQKGSIWIISKDIREEDELIPLSFIILEEAEKQELQNYNSLVWINPTPDNILFQNVYHNIQMFAQEQEYYFNKDPVREEHRWKNREWGKRKFRYNENGKDPGNVWIKEIDNDQGKIVEHKYYAKEKVIERILLCSANKTAKKL